VPPLTASQQERFNRVRALREGGRATVARDSLARLLAEVPHHPLLLVEMARIHESLRSWRAMETLARGERAASRDSLLLAQEMVTALERQGRARDAAGVVLEAVIAEPLHVEWARGWLDTLAARDPRGVRELVKRTVSGVGGRPEVTRLAALLEWRYGDAASAMHLLEAAEVPGPGMPFRWMFAEELLMQGSARDSAGAVEALFELAGDHSRAANDRLTAVRRAWEVAEARGTTTEAAPRAVRALKDVSGERWGSDLMLAVMRALREGGFAEESRGLMRDLGDRAQAIPEIALERALGDLRDGPVEKALPELRALADTLPEAAFRYAEALFFAGQPDSSHAWHERVANDPRAPFAGMSLERLYLIEDAQPREALVLYGRLAYEQWRGESRRALVLADSLYRGLPHGSLWAQAALSLAALREAIGDGKTALEPLLAVADGLPDDRQAPVARQRAGDVLRLWYKDEARALEQYEECLARYPKAWNAPEVRRLAESLRHERRF
jgi:tetratricopeptide (TPR) repeat protein